MNFPRPNFGVFREKRVWIPTVVGVVIVALIIIGIVYRSSVNSYVDRRIAGAIAGAEVSVAIDDVLQDPKAAEFVDNRIDAKIEGATVSKSDIERMINNALKDIDTSDEQITEKVEAAVKDLATSDENLKEILDEAVAAVIDAKVSPVQEQVKTASDAATKAQSDVDALVKRVDTLEKAKPPTPPPTTPAEFDRKAELQRLKEKYGVE